MTAISGLTKTEKNRFLTDLLKDLDLDTMPYEVMRAAAGKFVLTPIEIVIVRRAKKSELEVLLLKRADDDPDWPGMWHVPGTVLRQSDKSLSKLDIPLNDLFHKKRLHMLYHDAIKRIESKEINAKLLNIHFSFPIFHDQMRGKANAMVIAANIDESKPHKGSWYKIDNLPENTIPSHIKMIQEAKKIVWP